jgi:hypothetical protein
MRNRLFEVWLSHGEGIHVGPKFRLLADARRYIASHLDEASYAVRNPDGKWEMVVARGGPLPDRPFV